jgi:hypothetical protein
LTNLKRKGQDGKEEMLRRRRRRREKIGSKSLHKKLGKEITREVWKKES